MFLQNFIKKSLLLLGLSSSLFLYSQPLQTSKYNREYNPYFRFNTFKRGVPSEKIATQLDILDHKPKTEWSLDDSLEFAELSLLTQNFDLSQYYLESIEKNHSLDNKTKRLLLIDCYLTNDFTSGEKLIAREFNNSNQFDEYLQNIFLARKSYFDSSIIPNQILNIMPPNQLMIEKGSVDFDERIIYPLEETRDVMEFYVRHIHEDDPIIAKCFTEIGDVLEKHVSLNQAYIAFSIARIYDRNDKAILENVKRIKSKHVQKNYNTPTFRKYFPRIEYWRFDYEILKEKIINEKNDTIEKIVPQLVIEKNEPKFPFPKDLIIPLGILVILLLFTIFTRSEKK